MLQLQDYKNYAGINSPNQDDTLQVAVDYANKFIESFCGISLSRKTVTHKDIAGGSGSIVLPDYPVYSVNEVKAGGLVIDSEHYYLRDGVLYLDRPHMHWVMLTIEYTHGYETIPSDLKMAAIELVTYMVKREFNKSQSLGGENVTFLDPQSLPPHIRTPLELYRVI